MKPERKNLRFIAIILLGSLPLVDCGRREKVPGAESPISGAVSLQAMRDLIRERTSRFDGKGLVPCGNEFLCGSPVLPRFYEARDFVPAWIEEGRPTSAMDNLVTAIRDVWKEGLDPAFYRLSRVQSLVEDLKNGRGPNDANGFADLDMILSDSFLMLASHLESGAIDPETIKADWFIKTRQADLLAVLRDALAAGAIGESLYALHPRHPWYTSLEDALPPAFEIQKKGGWGEVPAGPTLKIGATGPRVEALLRRLLASGDMPEVASTTGPVAPAVFDDSLVEGVKRFQARHGLEPDGSVGPATIGTLNVPVERRIEQIKANLERWRWLPSNFGERYILVNIASFTLDVIENGHSVLSMPVIVGRDYRETPVFGAEMTYLVLNPTWTVPPKLAVEDILHKVQKDPGYLAAKKIRVFSDWTEKAVEVDPATIDWSALSATRFPYLLRQDPSPANSLGRIAFMLPNTYSVYLHDTPERWLFERAERILSSGCIRLADPIALAEYLLTGEKGWGRREIIDAIGKGVTRIVRLSRPIPVFLVYLTAWVDDRGIVHLQRDVYGRDTPLIRALAEPPPSPRPDGADIHVDKIGLGVVTHSSGF
ncbi:MAG: L,D-transpeptidase family protein [Candidatus Aminicenantes bacterium]|nr:L,D-transpeptidase family protein [Candidatus Aminicenantes bacterium]